MRCVDDKPLPSLKFRALITTKIFRNEISFSYFDLFRESLT